MSEMTDEQRTRLGEMVRRARLDRYATKSAAYLAAGINPQTWDRIEAGLSVKERTLRAAITTLWPGAAGDWARVLDVASVGGEQDVDYREPVSIDDRILELQKRLESLERQFYGSDVQATAEGGKLIPLPPMFGGREHEGLSPRPTVTRNLSDDDARMSELPLAAQTRNVQAEFEGRE